MTRSAEIPADVLERVKDGPVRGAIPRVENGVVRLIPWTEAARQRKPGGKNRWKLEEPTPIPAWMERQSQAALPPLISRSDRERYRVLVRRLFEDGQRFYRNAGHIAWPASVERELKALGWRMGKQDLAEQVEALARRYIVKAANQQKESDQRKVTLDHLGHYSA